MHNSLEQLILIFSKLPGLGMRSARKIVYHLIQDPKIRLKSLLEALKNVTHDICQCNCGNIDLQPICKICSDSMRNKKIIAVTENITDLWAIERSKVFKGTYFVLGSNMYARIGKEHLEYRLKELIKIIKINAVKEVIIATGSTIDGQMSAYFIGEVLKEHQVKISRIANGIPIGGELDYFDEGTLSAAISLRRYMD